MITIGGWADADHAETAPDSSRAVIAPLECSLVEFTNTIRLKPGTRLSRVYGREEIVEGYHSSLGARSRNGKISRAYEPIESTARTNPAAAQATHPARALRVH
jgi:hypothetical protein